MRFLLQNNKNQYLKSYKYNDKSMTDISSYEFSTRMDALIINSEQELKFLKEHINEEIREEKL